MIERLQQALTNPNMTQDDVCNLLSNDLYEREKMKYQVANLKERSTVTRLTCKHLSIIEQEISKTDENKNLVLLDSLLANLRYFKRMPQKTRD